MAFSITVVSTAIWERPRGVTAPEARAAPRPRGRSPPIPARTRTSRSEPLAGPAHAVRQSRRADADAAGRPVRVGRRGASWSPDSQELSPVPTEPCDSRVPDPANCPARSAVWALFRPDHVRLVD